MIKSFYKIIADVNNYQWIMPLDEELEMELVFDCASNKGVLTDSEWYCFNPKNKKGNFFTLGHSGALVFDKSVFDSELFTILEIAGEIIPIKMNGEELFILNVLACPNALNQEESIFDIYDDGTKGRPLKYEFHENRLTESSLFKIPQTSKGEIITYSGIKDKMDEFKSLYEYNGFTGLLFEELV